MVCYVAKVSGALHVTGCRYVLRKVKSRVIVNPRHISFVKICHGIF